eukprot:3899333-Pleurochrysis_carterae.AAC.1
MPPELPTGAWIFASHDLRAFAVARGKEPTAYNGKSVRDALQSTAADGGGGGDGTSPDTPNDVRWGVWEIGRTMRVSARDFTSQWLKEQAQKIFAPFNESIALSPLPSATGRIQLSGEMPRAMAEAVRRIRVPKYADEIQADAHLVYKLAGPVYLATPPLLTCTPTSGANSSIEHISAT